MEEGHGLPEPYSPCSSCPETLQSGHELQVEFGDRKQIRHNGGVLLNGFLSIVCSIYFLVQDHCSQGDPSLINLPPIKVIFGSKMSNRRIFSRFPLCRFFQVCINFTKDNTHTLLVCMQGNKPVENYPAPNLPLSPET